MDKLKNVDLDRFVTAQEAVYADVLAELRGGRKQTHWMWYIFPQIAGLGYSTRAIYYALAGLEEARQYLLHPLLGARLRECCEILLALKGSSSIADILGYPDNLKLQSCMTLFERAAEEPGLFIRVLDKYYGGERDAATLKLLAQPEKKG